MGLPDLNELGYFAILKYWRGLSNIPRRPKTLQEVFQLCKLEMAGNGGDKLYVCDGLSSLLLKGYISWSKLQAAKTQVMKEIKPYAFLFYWVQDHEQCPKEFKKCDRLNRESLLHPEYIALRDAFIDGLIEHCKEKGL